MDSDQRIIILKHESDLHYLFNAITALISPVGFSKLQQTQLITASSELARNMVRHADGGVVNIEELHVVGNRGVRISFKDSGPGIADIDLAMTKGFSTSSTLGIGLAGAKALVDEFKITTKVGSGTEIKITKWRNTLWKK